MAAGDYWFDCSNIKKILTIDQILRLLTVDDGSGNPAIRTYNPSSGGGSSLPLNSAMTPVLITDQAATKTLAGMYGEYTTWKTANPSKTPIRVTHLTGDDGQNGILIEFT